MQCRYFVLALINLSKQCDNLQRSHSTILLSIFSFIQNYSVICVYEKMLSVVSMQKMPFIYIMNKTGPNKVSCGTPWATSFPLLTTFVFFLEGSHESDLIQRPLLFQHFLKIVTVFNDYQFQSGLFLLDLFHFIGVFLKEVLGVCVYYNNQ